MTTTADDEKHPARSNRPDQENLRKLLANAEHQRRKVLSASLCFSAITGLSLSQLRVFDVAGIGPCVAAIVISLMCWQLSGRLWRARAIGVIAPELCARYGQTRFSTGWETLTAEDFLRNITDSRGYRQKSWESEGTYRGVSYRLSEQSIHEPRIGRGAASTPPRIVFVVEIAVPLAFTGRVVVKPRTLAADLITGIADYLPGGNNRVHSGHPEFDRLFEITSEGTTQLDKLISPAVIQSLLTITQGPIRKTFSARFEEGRFYLEFPIEHPTLRSVSLLTPMPTLIDAADALCWELTIPQRLTDAMMGLYDGPLR